MCMCMCVTVCIYKYMYLCLRACVHALMSTRYVVMQTPESSEKWSLGLEIDDCRSAESYRRYSSSTGISSPLIVTLDPCQHLQKTHDS